MYKNKKNLWKLARDEKGIFWALNTNTGEKILEEQYHYKMKTLKEKLEYLHEIDFVPEHINSAIKDAVLEFEEYLLKELLENIKMETKLIEKREKRLHYGLPQKDYIYSEDDVKEAVLRFKKHYMELMFIDEKTKEHMIKAYNIVFGDFESKNEDSEYIKDAKEEKTIYRKNNITYYKFIKDALERRNKGDRLYYKAGEGYYIIRSIKRGFWF